MKDQDEIVALAERTSKGLALAGAFGSYLVDYFPIRMFCQRKSTSFSTSLPQVKYVPLWVPGATFQKIAFEIRTASRELLDRPFREVRLRMECYYLGTD